MRFRVLLFALLLSPACDQAAEQTLPPDVLLVSLDTLRADRLGCYGYERETSPVLDALAAEGVRFHEVHAPSGNTKPSHMSLFTGLDPLAHDVRPVRLFATVRPALSDKVPTMPELLSRAGYQTASFTDRGGLPQSAGFGRGFDVQHAEWEELPRKIAVVKKYLATANPRLPLFLFFHTYEPHAPYLPPRPHRGKFTDPDHTGGFRQRYAELSGTPMAEFWLEKGKFLREWPEMESDDVEFLSGLYDEEISWTDQNVARLLRVWGKHRKRENTILIVLSDHGEAFNEHGRLGHQRSMYAELMRVPLIMTGPGLPSNLVVHEPVSLTGVLPTLLELLELDLPETQVDSFLALVRRDASPSAPIFSQMGNRGEDLFESVTLDDLRLLRTTLGGVEKLELFDWATDGGEEHNLAEERPADVARLVELLDRRKSEADVLRERFPPGSEGAQTEAELREIEGLGYGGPDDEEASPPQRREDPASPSKQAAVPRAKSDD